jgi:hypothetical protein
MVLALLSGCVNYYRPAPETVSDGIYFAGDDPGYTSYSPWVYGYPNYSPYYHYANYYYYPSYYYYSGYLHYGQHPYWAWYRPWYPHRGPWNPHYYTWQTHYPSHYQPQATPWSAHIGEPNAGPAGPPRNPVEPANLQVRYARTGDRPPNDHEDRGNMAAISFGAPIRVSQMPVPVGRSTTELIQAGTRTGGKYGPSRPGGPGSRPPTATIPHAQISAPGSRAQPRKRVVQPSVNTRRPKTANSVNNNQH